MTSIINPNRVIVQGAGYIGANGLSKMPGYSEAMTVQQLIDVVAYLKSLTAGHGDHANPPVSGHEKMEMR